jgi:hypothetical protein
LGSRDYALVSIRNRQNKGRLTTLQCCRFTFLIIIHLLDAISIPQYLHDSATHSGWTDRYSAIFFYRFTNNIIARDTRDISHRYSSNIRIRQIFEFVEYSSDSLQIKLLKEFEPIRSDRSPTGMRLLGILPSAPEIPGRGFAGNYYARWRTAYGVILILYPSISPNIKPIEKY